MLSCTRRLANEEIAASGAPASTYMEGGATYRCGQKDMSGLSRIYFDVLSFKLKSTKLGMNMGLPKGFHMTS